MTNEQGHQLPPLSPEALAALGGGKIAYVKPISPDDVKRLLPQAPQNAAPISFCAPHTSQVNTSVRCGRTTVFGRSRHLAEPWKRLGAAHRLSGGNRLHSGLHQTQRIRLGGPQGRDEPLG